MLRHRCGSVTVGATKVSCAETCAEWPLPPIADYSYIGGALVDQSTIYSAAQYSWQLVIGGEVIYDFGKGASGTVITEMANGSANSNFITGHNGSDIRDFIYTLPIFYTGQAVGLRLTLSDSYGREGKTIKYYLT